MQADQVQLIVAWLLRFSDAVRQRVLFDSSPGDLPELTHKEGDQVVWRLAALESTQKVGPLRVCLPSHSTLQPRP